MPRAIPAYDDLLIELRTGADGNHVVSVSSAAGAKASGAFALPFDEVELERLRLMLDPRTRRSRGPHSPHGDHVREFGDVLYQALVADDGVRELVTAAVTAAEVAGRGLRIRLSLAAAPNLCAIPWELLYKRPGFFAQSVWTPVVRYLDLSSTRQPLRVTGPLRVLGMISRPRGLDEVDAEREQANLERALKPLIEQRQVELRWLDRATTRHLADETTRGDDFHIFHYIGHGEFDERTGESSLVFEQADRRPSYVNREQLGLLLGDRRTLRLAVFNTCEAARTAEHDPLAGIAANLVERNVPAVVAMQFAITDDAAVRFAEEFYSSLADGYPVDVAVTHARQALVFYHRIEWATPVLFMRVHDGVLFRQELGPGPPGPPPWRQFVERARRAVASVGRRALARPVAGVVSVVRRGRRRPSGASGHRGKPPSLRTPVLAVAVTIALLLVAYFSLVPDDEGRPACRSALELRVLASADKEALVREATDDYMDDTEDGEGCRTVNVSLAAAHAPRRVIAALRRGWGGDALSEVGPQPDVWLPQSSAEVDQVDSTRAGGIRPTLIDEGSIANARLVLASPVDRVFVRTSDRELLRDLGTLRTNPESSSAGLLATHALYKTAGGEDRRRAIERDVPISGDDSGALLCQRRLALARLQQSAYLVPENVLADFNAGRPLGGPCAGPVARERDDRRLHRVEVVPDAPVFDHPCVRVSSSDAGGRARERRQAATRFCRHLQSDSLQRLRRDHGFADPGSEPPRLRPDRLLAQWEAARRPARVLLVVDVSRSMGQPLPPTGEDKRIDAAGRAARGALRLVDDEDDALGLWSFGGAAGRQAHAELAPLGPATDAHLERVEGALKALRPTAGGTPLYDAIAEGAARLRAGWRAGAINALVILTDGNDHGSRAYRTLERLNARLEAGDRQDGKPIRLFVIASLGARCERLLGVVPPYRGGCFEAGTQSELDETFSSVFASFGRGWRGVPEDE